ncbi:MAG: response regulator transcription factor [Paludibacteraceae bacterium]|nr:response regulator transcription factor [Bacteroidales bacterium]MBQ9100086.1 response regulator transcription factor [Paludibacteraceae bacterium]MBR6659568.1 response regulator transcription factor [Paludibacteraceae bacterium]
MVQEVIKTIIIDDEFPARKLLSEYASKIANIKLCGVCDNAVHALELLQNEEVDLIFTDIQMPDLSGMEFIRSLKNPPLIVFTTAHSEYAIDSYELEAVDYLLKPISFPRFVQAVNKVQERIQLLRSKECETKPEKDYFMVKADYKLYRIDFVNILFVEGQSEYVTFHLKDNKKITAYYALKKLEEELPSRDFMRIHKSYIVSLANIESVEGNLVTIAGQKLSIGKNYKDLLMDRLNC